MAKATHNSTGTAAIVATIAKGNSVLAVRTNAVPNTENTLAIIPTMNPAFRASRLTSATAVTPAMTAARAESKETTVKPFAPVKIDPTVKHAATVIFRLVDILNIPSFCIEITF
ncbi:hypothetical protein [Arthrobacter sp. YC-RL1]|uniref:hypothetical protein n=1 Tax=Arthrobacter sp. YC-RL1 TaxID=1652545 RepID=UPI0012FB0503|nr:hypothetical protein [Arthrobacter sp. YC-RL1]